MRYFFDTEFIEDGTTIDLISIGIVAEDGREYYAESVEADLSKAGDWVRANVLTQLGGVTAKARAQIAIDILDFVLFDPYSTGVEFWAYYADYDWVALCQLYGRMIDLPAPFPMFCMDLKQWAVQLNIDTKNIPLVNDKEHNALSDARWNRDVHRMLSNIAAALR